MVIGCCQIEAHLPASGSLKEKRKVVNRLRDRLRHRYNVSFAEVDYQDTWQRVGLALVAVSSHQPSLDSLFQSVREEVYRLVPGEVLRFEVEYL
jgi:uncharacterized protein YlxP (DUF503 family)